MLVFKKFNISFVFLLALLFSLSYAGTFTINGDVYENMPFNDYSINYGEKYCFFKYHYSSDVDFWYGLFIPNSEDQVYNDIDYVGHYSPSGNDRYSSYFLAESSTDLYDLTSVSGHLTYWNSAYGFNPASDFYTGTIFPIFSDSYDIEIIHSDWDYYSIDYFSGNSFTLDELLWDGTGGGGHYFFHSSQSSQQINDNTYDLLMSSVLPNNLPSTYTNFYVVYDENREIYYGFFFPKAIIPTGYIYQGVDGPFYQVEFLTSSVFGYRVFWFYYNGSEYALVNNFDPFDFSSIPWDFTDQPVVYSNFDFSFYRVTDGVVSDDPEFTISYSDITDSNNNVITSADVLNSSKDDDSIWSVLFSIFNPPSVSDMSEIESYHNQINSKADFNSFYDYYTRNTSFFSDLVAVRWLIIANNELYECFAGFLLMCCFFITLSRIINS